MVNTRRAVNTNKCTDDNTRNFEKYTEKTVKRHRIQEKIYNKLTKDMPKVSFS